MIYLFWRDFTKEEKKKVIHFRPVFYLFLAFMIGMIFSRKIYAGVLSYILLSACLFVGLFLVSLYRKKFIALILCLCAFFAGNGVYYLAANPYLSLPMYEEEVLVVGRVTDSITYRGNSATVVLENVSINGDKTKNIYLGISNVEKLQVGNYFAFETFVTRENLFELGSFSSYCVRQNIGYTASVDYLAIVRVEGDMHLDEKIRQSIKDTLFDNMSEENAGLAYAVITGDKSFVDADAYSYYKSTGIVHLLTVSGLHVGILISFIGFIFKKLKMKGWLNFLVTAILLLFYNYICGFAPSVMRASIMGLCLLLSMVLGKQRDGLVSLGVAGFLISLINPLYVFDSGFLMSFFCLAMIIILYKPLFRVFSKFLPKWASSYISLSLCSQIAIFPFLASFFQGINFLAFFVNLVIVPIFSFVFILLLVFTLLSIILNFLGPMLSLSNLTFSALTDIAKFYTDPIAMISLSPLDEGITISASLIIFVVSDFVMLKWKVKSYILCLLASLFMFAVVMSYVPNRNKTSEIYYISSYGDMICLRSKNGQSLIVGDAFTKSKFLIHEKIKSVDYLLLMDEPIVTDEKEMKFFENNILSFENYDSVENEKVLNKDETNVIGDFSITAIYTSEVRATKIEFDGISIFFTSASDLVYNIDDLNFLGTGEYDIAFIYTNIFLVDKIEAKKYIGPSFSSHIDHSHEEIGNMCFYGENLKLRSLD